MPQVRSSPAAWLGYRDAFAVIAAAILAALAIFLMGSRNHGSNATTSPKS